MIDDQDQPGQRMELMVPFVACVSHDGPYDDRSFVAGYQCGAVDRMLAVAQLAGAVKVAVPFAVHTDLGRQLELIGMNRGYPVVDVAEVGAGEGYDAMPQWSFVTFAASAEETP